MNTKTIPAAVLGAVISFFANWLIYGVLLQDQILDLMVHYDNLLRPEDQMILWANILSNLLLGFLYAYVIGLAGNPGSRKSLFIGATLGAFINVSYDLMMYSMANIFDKTLIGYDLIINMVIGGLMGWVIGWWTSRKS